MLFPPYDWWKSTISHGDHAAQATYLLRLLVFHETFHRGHAGAAEVAQAAAQGSAGHKQAEIYGRYI